MESYFFISLQFIHIIIYFDAHFVPNLFVGVLYLGFCILHHSLCSQVQDVLKSLILPLTQDSNQAFL